ncbi:MAG TPA: hypothetical protein VHK69_19990, partial [Chitinophagaceae bacterium]|nr:hypothetical protein [Chitinophagaceae bacterium]
NAEERSIFKERECPSVKQLSIQKTILQDILGIESAFVFLVQNKSLSETDVVTWKEVFQSLDYSSCPHYIRNWIHRL